MGFAEEQDGFPPNRLHSEAAVPGNARAVRTVTRAIASALMTASYTFSAMTGSNTVVTRPKMIECQGKAELEFGPTYVRSLKSAVRSLPSLLPVAHRPKELGVAFRLAHLREQQLHRLDRRQRREHLAEHVDAVQVLLRQQQFFLPRAALLDVDGGEHATVHQLAIEVDFHVARALELFEDDLIHARAGVDQRRGDDGQRAALFYVARRAEEPLRPLQRVAVHAARQDLAGGGHDRVVG